MKKNVLLYTSNPNKEWMTKTVNSINSFFHFNPELKETTTAVLITDQGKGSEIDMSKTTPGIDTMVIDKLSYNYAGIGLTHSNGTKKLPILYRFEPFANAAFDDCEVLLSMDGDVEFKQPCPELMQAREKPTLGFTFESWKGRIKQLYPKYHIKWYCNMGFMLLTPRLIGVERRREMFNDLIYTVENDFRDSHVPDQDAISLVFNRSSYGCDIVEFSSKYNYHPWAIRKVIGDRVVVQHHIRDKNYPLKYI